MSEEGVVGLILGIALAGLLAFHIVVYGWDGMPELVVGILLGGAVIAGAHLFARWWVNRNKNHS